MIDKKIEQIRQQLNQMMICDNADKEKILLKSQELDLLILKSMEVKKRMLTKRMILEEETANDPESLLHKDNILEYDYKVLAIDRLLKLADKKMYLAKVKARRVG